jgi:hypothetical protein
MRFYVTMRGRMYQATNRLLTYSASNPSELEEMVTYYHPSAVFYHI